MKRFPAPWDYEEEDGCFTVRDADGRMIAHIDFRSSAKERDAPSLSREEAKGIAAGIARLPNLIQFQA